MFKATLSILRTLALPITISLLNLSCAHNAQAPHFKTALEYSRSTDFDSGRLVIVQGPTSDTETNINVLAPRLKNYKYLVMDAAGTSYKVEKYETLQPDVLLWKLDKISVTGLKPHSDYTLKIVDEFRGSQTLVDTRIFNTLDIKQPDIKFSYASCMSDDYRFNDIIDPMWTRMQEQNPDFVVLNGDVVYVDSFEFVERTKATELDIWQRFIASFERLPLYHWKHLKPIFATWDDHDFGTNDSDRTFASKKAARKVFLGFFGGQNIPGVYSLEKESVYFSLKAFNQRFIFLDDRYFRQPDKDKPEEEYAHWGETQHKWVFSQLNSDATPTWLFDGDQFFSGVDLSYKESLQSNHPAHFKKIMGELKTAKAPVIFASGDIHFSEIMQIPKEAPNGVGYNTFEVTSSSMHSFTGTGWDNPLRVPGAFTREFNFMMIRSKNENGGFKVNVESWGLADKPYFTQNFEVKR